MLLLPKDSVVSAVKRIAYLRGEIFPYYLNRGRVRKQLVVTREDNAYELIFWVDPDVLSEHTVKEYLVAFPATPDVVAVIKASVLSRRGGARHNRPFNPFAR